MTKSARPPLSGFPPEDVVIVDLEDLEPVAEPSAMFVLPFCGEPDPPLAPWQQRCAEGRCPFHGGAPTISGPYSCGPECEFCEREAQEARGCRCGGTMRCPGCLGGSRCEEDCDGLCPVCCPDS